MTEHIQGQQKRRHLSHLPERLGSAVISFRLHGLPLASILGPFILANLSLNSGE
jgi:hypothetical protein